MRIVEKMQTLMERKVPLDGMFIVRCTLKPTCTCRETNPYLIVGNKFEILIQK